MGARILELYCYREKSSKRETKFIGILSFIHTNVWKVLFGKTADSLEKSTEQEDECISIILVLVYYQYKINYYLIYIVNI